MADEIKGPDKGDGVKRTDLSAERPSFLGLPYGTEPAPEITLRAAPPVVILRGKPAELLTWWMSTAAWFWLLQDRAGLNRPAAIALSVGATVFFGALGPGGWFRWRGRGGRKGGED
jgi:hypothetical protein